MNVAEQAASLRADVAALEAMEREVKYEYTSKKRLQIIAAATLGALLTQYRAGVAALDAAAAQEADAPAPSGLILPADAEKGIVTA